VATEGVLAHLIAEAPFLALVLVCKLKVIKMKNNTENIVQLR